MSTFDGPNVVTNGLIFYIDAFNKQSYSGSGNICTDLTSYKNRATLINSPTFSNDGFTFNGTNQKISATIPTFSGNGYTLQGWAKITLNKKGAIFKTGANNGFAVGQGDGTFGGQGNKLLGLYPAVSWIDSGYFFTSSGWYFITMTIAPFSDKTIKFYINNIMVRSISTTTWFLTLSNDFIIGSNYGDAEAIRFFEGSVMTSLVYDRNISHSEVIQNFNATRSRFNI